jgi:hypothetical protein
MVESASGPYELKFKIQGIKAKKKGRKSVTKII